MSRRWVTRIGSAFAAWATLTLVLRVFGNHPDAGLLALVVAAVATTLWLCLDVLDRLRAPSWDRHDTEPTRPPGEDPRLAALTRVVSAHLEARVVDVALQRQLMTLVDQRLTAMHGVSWRVDPERAGPFLDSELLALARQSPPYPRMSLQRIDVLLSRIEAL